MEATRGPKLPRPRRGTAPGKTPVADRQGRQARNSGHALTGAAAHQTWRDKRPTISPARRQGKGRRPPCRGSRGPARHGRDRRCTGCRAGCRVQDRRWVPGVARARRRMSGQPEIQQTAPTGATRTKVGHGPRPWRPWRHEVPGGTPAATGQGRQARSSNTAGKTGAAAHRQKCGERRMTCRRRQGEERRRRPCRDSRGPVQHGRDRRCTGCRMGCRLQGRR